MQQSSNVMSLEKSKLKSNTQSSTEYADQLVSFPGCDDRLATVEDLKILQKNFLNLFTKFENKLKVENHKILSNMTQFSSKYYEEIENLTQNIQVSLGQNRKNERLTKNNQQYPFPLKSWEDLVSFCTAIEGDENYREAKVINTLCIKK